MYEKVKFENLLTAIVNYHVEGAINDIIQILINNTGQRKHLRYLQIPPGKIMNELVYNLSTVNYSSVKLQAIPIILRILKEQFPDSIVKADPLSTYILIDWS